MESALRTALIAWLRSDSLLASGTNAIEEEAPVTASPPCLTIVASASADWSSKTSTGREVRIAFELTDRRDKPENTATLASRIEQRIATLDPDQPGFRVVSTQFLRSRVERRARSLRAVLLEYRFRLLETPTE